MYVVLQLLSGGELFDRIVNVGYFLEKKLDRIQIGNAVTFLHSNGIVHRQLRIDTIC